MHCYAVLVQESCGGGNLLFKNKGLSPFPEKRVFAIE